MAKKLVKDSTIREILLNGMYYVSGYDQWVCSLCHDDFELRMDVIDHIIEVHMDDLLPDGNSIIDPDVIPEKKSIIDPDELELY